MNSVNLNFKVIKKDFNKKNIFVPTSKSYANRLLILASLFEKPIKIRKLPESTDVVTMIDCLKKIGLDVSGNFEELSINNSFPDCEVEGDEIIYLETKDGGTTNRFLMGLLALGKREYRLVPTLRISQRPIDKFVNTLMQSGVKVEYPKDAWLSIQGPLEIKDIEIDVSESTQFATALQMALTTFGKTVKVKNLVASAKYLEITNFLCSEFKSGCQNFIVPLDFSSFGYPIALAAVIGELSLDDFSGIDNFQADSELLSILHKMEANLTIDKNNLSIKKSKLRAVDISCEDFPDLVPTLAFLASYAIGESRLRNIKVLRHKESDRITEVLKILQAFAIECKYDEQDDCLFIKGGLPIERYVELETAKDHRMIMVSYLFMRVNNGGTLYNVEHINKSYPRFLEVMD